MLGLDTFSELFKIQLAIRLPLGTLFPLRASLCSPLPSLPGIATAALASHPGGAAAFCIFYKRVVPMLAVYY